MIEFLSEYAMFAAKLATVVVLLFLLIGTLIVLIGRARGGGGVRLKVKSLNDKYETMGMMLNAAILPSKEFKRELKQKKRQHKIEAKQVDSKKSRNVFALAFKGDVSASEVTSLRDSITAVLTVAKPDDEIVVSLESYGGAIHGYGLAASQLCRIRDKGLKLTVAVDKVAASGGYMMACVADHIIAAPFAILGSVGVVAQLPNFHKLLKNNDIDFELVTAGEYKRTLTLFGENTDKGREKFREDVEVAHGLFKDFITRYREQVDINKVSTGEHWYGTQALDLKLIDQIGTSDDYLYQASQSAKIYEVNYGVKKSLLARLFPASED